MMIRASKKKRFYQDEAKVSAQFEQVGLGEVAVPVEVMRYRLQ